MSKNNKILELEAEFRSLVIEELKTIKNTNNTQFEEVDNRLNGIEKILVSQEINLKEHMKRSDSLEILVQNIKETELKPLQKHVHLVEGGFKLLGLISLLLGIAVTIFRLFKV